MSSLTAVVDPKDMRELQALFAKVEKLGINSTERLINQTIIHAARSAAVATKPRKGRTSGGNIRGGKLAKKNLFRPLVKLPANMGFWYVRLDSARKLPFQSDYKIKTTEMKRRNLKRVTKAVKLWDKKKGGWSYKPYFGKRDTKKKVFRIPYAGLAKEAWMRGFKKLGGKGSIPTLRRNAKAGRTYNTKRSFLYAEIANLVSYVSKSSRGAARYGLNRAKNKMKAIYAPKIDKKMQRKLDTL